MKVMPVLAGVLAKNVLNASRPPAEAPRPTTMWFDRAIGLQPCRVRAYTRDQSDAMGGEILLLLFFLFFRVCGKTRSTRVGLVGRQPGERRNCALLIVAWLGTLPCHRLPLHCSWIARRIRLRPGSVVVAWPVAILVVVSAIIPAIVIGTAAVVPVAVIAARTYGVHLNEISVI